MNQRVSVIGLGRMGSALATTLLEDHYKVTVWNRTASKAKHLVEAGATLAASVNGAIDDSEVIIVCLGDYGATNQIFSGCADLTGKTLIQLTWGTAGEAESMRDWAEGKKALYLDGLIIAFPSQIGNDETLLIVGGSEEAWRSGEHPSRGTDGHDWRVQAYRWIHVPRAGVVWRGQAQITRSRRAPPPSS